MNDAKRSKGVIRILKFTGYSLSECSKTGSHLSESVANIFQCCFPSAENRFEEVAYTANSGQTTSDLLHDRDHLFNQISRRTRGCRIKNRFSIFICAVYLFRECLHAASELRQFASEISKRHILTFKQILKAKRFHFGKLTLHIADGIQKTDRIRKIHRDCLFLGLIKSSGACIKIVYPVAKKIKICRQVIKALFFTEDDFRPSAGIGQFVGKPSDRRKSISRLGKVDRSNLTGFFVNDLSRLRKMRHGASKLGNIFPKSCQLILLNKVSILVFEGLNSLGKICSKIHGKQLGLQITEEFKCTESFLRPRSKATSGLFKGNKRASKSR